MPQRKRAPRKISPVPMLELVEKEGLSQEDVEAALDLPEEPRATAPQPLVPDADFVDFPSESLSETQRAFLIGYLMWGTSTKACFVTKTSPFTVEKWKKDNKEFLTAYKLVEEAIGDVLEDKAIQLAMRGNDKLLSKLLSGFKPQKYGRKIEVGGPVGTAITTFADLARRYFGGDSSQDDYGTGSEKASDSSKV